MLQNHLSSTTKNEFTPFSFKSKCSPPVPVIAIYDKHISFIWNSIKEFHMRKNHNK